MAEIKRFLDTTGAKLLSRQLAEKIREDQSAKLKAKMVLTVDASGTDDQIATAKAVYTAIDGIGSPVVGFEIVEVLPAIGVTNVIYLIQDLVTPTLYAQHVYIDDRWIQLNGVDLSTYWAKEELVVMPESEIVDIITEIFP